MENCLVTKLKGGASDSNLPVYNTVFLDYTGTTGSTDAILLIEPVDGKTLKLNSKFNIHVGSATAAPTTSVDITTKTVVYVVPSDAGTEPITRAIEIKGCYDIKSLVVYGSGSANIDFILATPNPENGLNSMLNYSNVDKFGGCFDSENFPNVIGKSKYVYINRETVNELFTIDELDSQCVSGSMISGGLPFINVTDNLKGNTSIMQLNARLSGNIKNLPKNIKVFNIIAASTVGSIEEFIETRRSLGVSSGLVAMVVSSEASVVSVTYNGTSLRTLINNNTIPVYTYSGVDYVIMSWGATGDPSFSSTLPSELEGYVPILGPYNWEPFV